jgi:Zn-dependent oligopeptidase
MGCSGVGFDFAASIPQTYRPGDDEMNDPWWWQSVGSLKARSVPLLEEARALADRAVETSDWVAVLETLDELARLLDHPRAVSALLAAGHPHEAIRRAALEVHLDLLTFLSDVLSDPSLYTSLSDEVVEGAEEGLAVVRTRSLESLRIHGADRTHQERTHVAAMRSIISRTGALYRRHLSVGASVVPIDDPSALEGMDAAWRVEHLRSHEGQLQLQVTQGVAASVLAQCDVESTRQRVWSALNTQGWPDNAPVLLRLLEARQGLAESLGFADWATLEVGLTMAREVERVQGFLKRVEGVARSAAEHEREHLTSAQDGEHLPPWSRPWARERRGPREPECLLATPRHVAATLREVLESALGWRVRELEAASIWARAGKTPGAKTMRVRTGVAGSVAPAAALIASLPLGTPMCHADVVALFHEVGHVVHHLCASRSPWITLNGLPSGRDAIELSPHVFEAWAWEPEVLNRLGWSGAAAQVLQERDRATRGARVMRQVLYSDYSLSIHLRGGLAEGFDALDAAMFQRHGDGADYAERLYAHFPHLIAYGATYFAYPWSRAMACDVLAQISGPTCAPGALQPFMREVLCPGRSQDASVGLNRLLGRAWTVQPYLDWIDAARSPAQAS